MGDTMYSDGFAGAYWGAAMRLLRPLYDLKRGDCTISALSSRISSCSSPARDRSASASECIGDDGRVIAMDSYSS